MQQVDPHQSHLNLKIVYPRYKKRDRSVTNYFSKIVFDYEKLKSVALISENHSFMESLGTLNGQERSSREELSLGTTSGKPAPYVHVPASKTKILLLKKLKKTFYPIT